MEHNLTQARYIQKKYGEFYIFGKYLYYEPILDICCDEKSQAKTAFKQIQNELKRHKNSYFVGYVSYELGILEYLECGAKSKKLDFSVDFGGNFPADSRANSSDSCVDSSLPLLHFRLFAKRKNLFDILSCTKAKYRKNSYSKFLPTIIRPIDKERYAKDFSAIKNELKNGNSYQINYTQEMRLSTHLNGKEIFWLLTPRQNTKYKAYLRTPFVEICSFSPELFFALKQHKKQHKIIVEPMKGTMPRSTDKSQDKSNKKALANDTKNIAENIMIVDLLRNDLHKIAKNLSYKLLQIKTYKTLHQMTSKISATLQKEAILDIPKNHKKSKQKHSKQNLLYNIFRALFPCGSISGAPKQSSTQIIEKLEQRKRGIYCGAIGVIGQKEATFSVAIRTLFRLNPQKQWRYGVGSGVVWDSVCDDEIAELELKSKFLENTEKYALIETILIKQNRAFLLSSHLDRITKSAKELGFDMTNLERLFGAKSFSQRIELIKNTGKFIDKFVDFSPCACKNAWENLPPKVLKALGQKSKKQILRLLLYKNGELKLEILPFVPIQSRTIKIAKNKLESRNDALYHKSTLRAHFTHIPSKQNNVFDFIYLNEKGEVCEGSRSNVVILQDNVLYTPSTKSGLLNGVLRDNFIHSNILCEKSLTLKDLQNAQKIFCINSVRGVQEVRLF